MVDSQVGILSVEYDITKNRVKFGGNIRPSGRVGVLEWFLREQIGAGADHRTHNEKDIYHIALRWTPDYDIVDVIKDDTGNLGLRDGILARALQEANSSQPAQSPSN